MNYYDYKQVNGEIAFLAGSMNELALLPKAVYTHGTHSAPSASPREKPITSEDLT